MESQDRKSRRNVRAPALDEVHIYSSPQAVHASGSNTPDESHILQVDSRARGTSPTVPSTHRRSETGYENPAEMPLHTTPNPADTHVDTEDDSHQILSARGDPSFDYGTAQNKRSYADQTEHNASVSGYSTLESSQKHRKEHIQHQIQLSNKNRNQSSPSRKHNTSPTREENVSSQRGHDRCPQNPSRSRSRSPQRRRSSRPQRERSRTPQRGTRVTESRSPQRERSRTQQRGTQKRGSSSPHRRHSRSSRREHYRGGSESPQRGRSRSPQRRQSTENRRRSSQRRHSRSPQNRQSTSPQNRRSTTPRNRCRSPRMHHTQSPNCDTHKMNPRDNLGLEHVHSHRRAQSPTHDGGISPSMRNSRGRSFQSPNLLQKSNLPNRYDQGRGQNNFDTESYRSPGLLNKSIIDPGKSLRRHDREPISSQGNYQCQGKDMKGSAERTSGSERHYNESARGRESSSSLHPKLCQQGPSSSHVRESHHQVRAYHFQDTYQRAIHGEDLPSAFGQGQGQTSTRTSNHENNPQHVREGHHPLVRDYHPQDRCQRKIHEEALSYASGPERVQTPTRTYHHESRHQAPSMHSVGMLSNLSSQGLVIQSDSKQQRTPTKAVPRKFTSDSSYRDKPRFSQIAQDRLSPYCPQENQVPEGRSHITQETQREKGSSYDQTASTLEHHVPYTATSPLSPKNWTDGSEAFMNPSFHLLGKGVGFAPENRTKMRVKSPSSPKSSRGIHESPGSRKDRPQQYHEDCLIPVDLITSNNKDEATTAPQIKNPPSQYIQPATHDSETIHNSSPDDSPLCIPRRSHTTSFLRRITSPTNSTDDIIQHIGDIKNAIENSNKMSPLQRYLDDDSGTKILATQRGLTPAQKSETSKQRQPQYASKPEQKIDQNDPLDVHINSDKNKIKSKNIQTLYSESGYRILSRAKNQSVPSKTGQGNAQGAVIVNDRENAQEVPSALNSDTRMNKTKEKGTSHALNINRAPSTMLHDSKTSNKNIQHIKDAKNNHGITQVFSNTNIINKDKTKQRKILPPTMETKNETPTRVKQQMSIPGASKLNTQPEENRSDVHSPHNDVSDKHREMKIRIQTPLSKIQVRPSACKAQNLEKHTDMQLKPPPERTKADNKQIAAKRKVAEIGVIQTERSRKQSGKSASINLEPSVSAPLQDSRPHHGLQEHEPSGSQIDNLRQEEINQNPPAHTTTKKRKCKCRMRKERKRQKQKDKEKQSQQEIQKEGPLLPHHSTEETCHKMLRIGSESSYQFVTLKTNDQNLDQHPHTQQEQSARVIDLATETAQAFYQRLEFMITTCGREKEDGTEAIIKVYSDYAKGKEAAAIEKSKRLSWPQNPPTNKTTSRKCRNKVENDTEKKGDSPIEDTICGEEDEEVEIVDEEEVHAMKPATNNTGKIGDEGRDTYITEYYQNPNAPIGDLQSTQGFGPRHEELTMDVEKKNGPTLQAGAGKRGHYQEHQNTADPRKISLPTTAGDMDVEVQNDAGRQIAPPSKDDVQQSGDPQAGKGSTIRDAIARARAAKEARASNAVSQERQAFRRQLEEVQRKAKNDRKFYGLFKSKYYKMFIPDGDSQGE